MSQCGLDSPMLEIPSKLVSHITSLATSTQCQQHIDLKGHDGDGKSVGCFCNKYHTSSILSKVGDLGVEEAFQNAGFAMNNTQTHLFIPDLENDTYCQAIKLKGHRKMSYLVATIMLLRRSCGVFRISGL